MFDPHSPFTTAPDPLLPRQKSDLAEERLRLAALHCQLAPGTTATEADLADRFGLGRAATRSALAKLSAQGLMLAIPRLGWRALPMTGAHIGQVLHAIAFAEGALADADLTSRDKDRLQELAAIAATLGDRAEPAARDSLRSYERMARDLAADRINPLIGQLLSTLWDKADRIRRFLEMTTGARLPATDMAGLCDALIRGDADALARACRADQQAFRNFAADGLMQTRNELELTPAPSGTKTAMTAFSRPDAGKDAPTPTVRIK